MAYKNKSVVIIGINYYPEDTAIGLYTTQKAEFLTEKGFDVTVITGFPYYPQWKIRADYKNKASLLKETINGVKVLRSKQYVPSNPTFIKRIIHLISFTFGNFINLFRIAKPDIVISIIPFTTSALLGWFLKIRYKTKLWVHIQDFEFDAALDSGLLKGNSKTIFKLFLWIEKMVLSKADVVSTISFGMLKRLEQKTNVQSYYLPNWIDISLFTTKNENKHPYFSSKKFSILYSGNIGAKQDWALFLDLLKNLEFVNDIEVILVGEGAEKDNVLSELSQYTFVKHYNLVPYEELPLLLDSTDIHILFQKQNVIDTVMPSKLIGMMASAKPSIVTGNEKSEVAKVFKESLCGYYFHENSVKDILAKIGELKNNQMLCKTLGENAKKYVIEKFSKDKVLNTFLKELEKV